MAKTRTRINPRTNQINLRIEPEIQKAATTLAASKGLPLAHVVRALLAKWLRGEVNVQ